MHNRTRAIKMPPLRPGGYACERNKEFRTVSRRDRRERKRKDAAVLLLTGTLTVGVTPWKARLAVAPFIICNTNTAVSSCIFYEVRTQTHTRPYRRRTSNVLTALLVTPHQPLTFNYKRDYAETKSCVHARNYVH